MEQTIDIKLQAFVGVVNPVKADFRASQGQFVGAPNDNHTTIHEIRATGEDLEALGLTVDGVIKACETINKLAALKIAAPDEVKKLAEKVGGPIVSPFLDKAVAGAAIRVYDKD